MVRAIVRQMRKAVAAALTGLPLFIAACADEGSVDGEDRRAGTVTMFNDTYSSTALVTFDAQFDARPSVAGCTQTASGPCVLNECPLPPTVNTHVDAGTLTFSTPGVDSVELVPSADFSYLAARLNGTWALVPGTAIQVSASGAVVPAFAASFSEPEELNIASPHPASIDRAAGFAINWAVGPPQLQVLLNVGAMSTSGDSVQRSITCIFDASAGTGSAPASLLQHLPAGGAFYSVTAKRSVSVAAGAWDVVVVGSRFLVTPGSPPTNFGGNVPLN